MLRRRLTCALGALTLATSLVTALGAAAPSGAALGTGTGATTAGGLGPGTLAARQRSTLRATPKRFVGGQALTFTGHLAGAPRAQLKVQTLFDRPGDRWTTRPGIVGTTDDQGDFRFVLPAPSNYGIRYRVKAVGGPSGSAVRFEPRQQELVLSLDGGAAQRPGAVVSGSRFWIDVDTTTRGRGDLGRPAPAYPGRPLALQQRVLGNQWATVAQAVASAEGTARFELMAGAPGTTAYRVRQEAISTGGNQIGWFPSFPLEVRVTGTAAAARAAAPSPVAATSSSRRPAPAALAPSPVGRGSTGGGQAGQRYRWGPTEYDFAWERGESLTARPSRGRDRTGRWVDRSNGSGRAAPYNGGMALSTNVSELPGRGDHGSTSVTLEGNAMTYGRWEFRRRIDVFEKGGRDYRVKIELVPADADERCGADTITVSDVAFNSTSTRIGVDSSRAGRTWSGERRIPQLGDRPHAIAVEVTPSHITWFLDGRSLATVSNPKAVPGVPLTPRLSLVGSQRKEMRRTRVLYDWQRAWGLNHQARRAATGPGLKAKNGSKAC